MQTPASAVPHDFGDREIYNRNDERNNNNSVGDPDDGEERRRREDDLRAELLSRSATDGALATHAKTPNATPMASRSG